MLKSLTTRSKPSRATCKPLELSYAPRPRPENLRALGRPELQHPASADRHARHLFP